MRRLIGFIDPEAVSVSQILRRNERQIAVAISLLAGGGTVPFGQFTATLREAGKKLLVESDAVEIGTRTRFWCL